MMKAMMKKMVKAMKECFEKKGAVNTKYSACNTVAFDMFNTYVM